MLNKSVFFVVIFHFLAFISFSQDTLIVSIPWENPREIKIKDRTIIAPYIKDQNYNLNIPEFYFYKKIKSSLHSKFVFYNYKTTDAIQEEINYLQNQSIKVSDKIDIEYKITSASQSVYAVVNLFPFILENGIIKRIISLEFHIDNNVSLNQIKKLKTYATNSVLQNGSGSWYKIGVKSDGVVKIDKSFLTSCGINTSNLNPSSINIFGNGEGKLPELNSIFRSDDLIKNSIYISGESDGVFNEEDFILFYAWGPNRWYNNKNSNVFYHDKNIYSDYSYYFINVNPNDVPARISSINSTLKNVTDVVSSYSYYDTHESDLISLVGGGQRWYGEMFDTQLSQIFNFSIANIDSNVPVDIEVSMASNASVSPGTSQNYLVNGQLISSSSLPIGDYGRTELKMKLINPNSSIPLEINVVRNSPSTKIYLDKITVNARRNLVFSGTQLNFRDLNSVGANKIGNFLISNSPGSIQVWDVTDRHLPKIVNGIFSGSTYSFQLETDSLREFVVFDNINFQTPEKIGVIENQNLHGLSQADYLIVTHASFIDQANRLADLHRAEGLKVNVATTDQIYNEFSSGMLDPTAIRSFAKMFYERSLVIGYGAPKYLLLFGDGTYDPKNRIANNNNFIPTYQVLYSENHISAMVSDDYYGFFDPMESMNPTDLLDIGIGRLLISDNTIAKQQVDKIEHYLKNGSTLFSTNNSFCVSNGVSTTSTFGDWRLKYVSIADDEEGGYFVTQDTEPNSIYTQSNYPDMNCDKIYLDAYTQISNAGGQRYPEVYDAINDRVQRGAIVVNYVGHGGETGVAEERVITIPQIQEWKNIDRMNLMVSATCEFTKYDDPSRISAGEWVSLNPYGGSIALMTTTRSVFFGVNTLTGAKFYENVFSRDADNLPLTFGEIIRRTKNASGSSDNKRSFTLIGDPALRIAIPKMRIITDSINALSPSIEIDTIRALSKITIKGHVEDFSSKVLSDFNGYLSPTIFDKPKNLVTLGQDDTSPIIPFSIQKNAIYKGKVNVKNGYFTFSFIVPKDIKYNYGKGKISYYAENGVFDASGSDERLIIGGVDPVGIQDDIGPEIKMYLNDENFANYSITDESPILHVKLRDENGINTVGNGIGHDILAILDGNTSKPIVLNDYYSADLDSYQSGSIQYNFSKLEKGRHTLSLKVWDVNNNSSEVSIEFFVQEKQDLSLSHVLNYPNPFTTKTEFYFEHNQVCSELETQIQIFTISGQLVKTINQAVHTNGFRSFGIPWDGLDEYGDKLAKGVYVYRLSVKNSDGKKAEKLEKLVILK